MIKKVVLLLSILSFGGVAFAAGSADMNKSPEHAAAKEDHHEKHKHKKHKHEDHKDAGSEHHEDKK